MAQCERRKPLRGIWPALLTAAFLSGCSGAKPAIKLHQVSGTLKREGNPVPNLLVHFVPDKGNPSLGIAGPDGRFILNYQKDRPGALPGVHKVWVEYRPRTPQEDIEMREGKLQLEDDQKDVLEKYGSAETTTLKITIDGDTKDLVVPLD
jgi:hypothetical protein